MSWSIGTVYTKPWFWKKGNRVSSISDSLIIKIGGNPDDKKANKKRESNRIKSTKYSLITFLPQNLLEQFRRIANFYFLIMTVIALVINSPVSPLTSLIPLVFVIAVTAAKQGYEDYLRHRADNMVNHSLVTVIRNGEDIDIKCQDILQGDLVQIPRDCDVPCDLVLLKSSEPNGKCHITTANLDGETNLKSLSTPKGLPDVDTSKLHTLGHIECEHSTADLYSFLGKIELDISFMNRNEMTNIETGSLHTSELPLMADNLMLRGARVKNTEWAIGCAVYTGQSTKLALNSKITRNKVSSSETYINKFLVFFIILLIGIVTISYFMKRYFAKFIDPILRYFDLFAYMHNHYLGEPVDDFQVSQFLQDYFSFLILFNYLIPISLYVTIEMHKFLGSLFMEWDPDLYDEETNQHCIVNTSDLNEELGQVRLLFSDKTGTLTKNIMIFQQCSIAGNRFYHEGTSLRETDTGKFYKIHEFKENIFNFFQALAVCHTVQIAGDSGGAESRKSSNLSNFHEIIEETDSSQFLDSENDEPITFSRPSNTSNDSRPLSLRDFERISMKNNINKRNGDLNPLLYRKRYGIDDELNFLGRPTNPTNINDLNEIECIQTQNKVNKRPISEHFMMPADNRINLHRPLSFVENSLTQLHDMIDTKNSIQPKIIPIQVPIMSIDGKGILKRTISVTDEIKTAQTLGHRRTQSHGTPATVRFTTVRPLTRHPSIRSSTREYYAAPSYTGASLLERKESVMRKGAIKTVIDSLDYQASSPDEKALVEACASLGFIYAGDDNDILNIKLKTAFYRVDRDNFDSVDDALDKLKSDNNNSIKFKRLSILEFTSDRKRMSVIVKDSLGQLWLFTKGAESHVLPLCTEDSRYEIDLRKKTQAHVDEFAKQGLRTLAVARKKLSVGDFANYNNELLQANNSLSDRKHLVEECQRKIETNLELLGATAVEDALQDNVRDTLESLRMAGIKVWVLTGDKVETALNIALSCGHIPENAFKYFITDCENEMELHQHLDAFKTEMKRNPEQVYTLLIDGFSLTIALSQCSEKFRDIAINCRAVLCCRLSPLQKCEVVQLMKTVEGKPITAAIGDGANDVSMIQEAHVGLGIVGKEGRQAARCADYAFANFSMVKKILLVHGHYFSNRLALLVLYFFYKNLVFMACQFFFQIDSLFSSQSLYDSLFLTLYNVVYTALPVLFISLTEKAHTEENLMKHPELYIKISKNKQLTWMYFIGWMLLGLYHGVLIYYFSWIVWWNNNTILYNSKTANFSCFGTFLIHNVVVIVNLKLWLEAVYQSYMFILTIWVSILGFVLTTLIYNFFNLNYDGDMLWVYNNLLASPVFWLLSTVVIIACLIPDYAIKVCKVLNLRVSHFYPGSREQARQKKQRGDIESTYL